MDKSNLNCRMRKEKMTKVKRKKERSIKVIPQPTTEVLITEPKTETCSETKLPPRVSEQFGLCCCCMELPCPKNMWLQYSWMESIEIYGEMLEKCFGFSFQEEIKSKQQICEVCITRLRDSMRFKQQVADCTKRLIDNLHNVKNCKSAETIKQELTTTDAFDSNDDLQNGDDDNEADKIQEKMDSENEKKYEVTEEISKPKTKDRRSSEQTPRANIGLLLQNTTILPFKSNRGYFNCFYCGKQFVVIEELRIHVNGTHKNVTFSSIVKNILRPNDRVKADIGNVSCKICGENLLGMEVIVQHLESKHNVKFNYKDKILKPTECLLCYDLKDGKFACVICRSEFYFFKTLTRHMNEHSTNFVCDVCGKCFLLAERLKAHTQVHINSTVSCEICGKVCLTAGRLRSHTRHHHSKRSYVCSICNKSFQTFRLRMQHFEDVHNRSPLDLSCKVCLKSFKTTSHLGCHMRTEHFNIPYVRKRKK